MKMRPGDIASIVHLYTVELIPMITLAARYQVTRMAIWKVLHRQGVDTSKAASHIKTTCKHCGDEIFKTRCQYRKTLHMFCDTYCYRAWLRRRDNDNPLISSRHRIRMARKAISAHFFIPYGAVVHHEDKDTANNAIQNLRVFKCNGDHVRHHRGFVVAPIFDGSNPKYSTL